MSYRNKTYVAFNADYPPGGGDLKYYNMMTAWKANDKIEFDFHNAHDLNNLTSGASDRQIYLKLKERMKNAKQLVLLVGDHTKNMYKFVRWEIEIAIEMDIPIIAANLDKSNCATNKTPPILKKSCYFVNVPFEMKKIRYALDNFPTDYHKEKHNSPPSRSYNWSKINPN